MIALYIVGSIGIGFSMGLLAAAIYIEYRMKKRQRDFAKLVGELQMGNTIHCREPEFWEMEEGPDEPDDYMEKCYEYELKCKEDNEK